MYFRALPEREIELRALVYNFPLSCELQRELRRSQFSNPRRFRMPLSDSNGEFRSRLDGGPYNFPHYVVRPFGIDRTQENVPVEVAGKFGSSTLNRAFRVEQLCCRCKKKRCFPGDYLV